MRGSRSVFSALAVVCAVGLTAVDHAEAKRGVSIGSRGTRTQQAPATTPTAPTPAAPIQRTTTPAAAPASTPSATPQAGPQAQPQAATNSAAARPAQQAARPSMFGGGLGGSLMRGLLIGGLIGMVMGAGFGGLAGLLGLLVQGLLIALVVMLALRFFRSRSPAPATAGGYGSARGYGPTPGAGGLSGGLAGLAGGLSGGGSAPAGTAAPGAATPAAASHPGGAASPGRDELGLTPADLDTFERLLAEVHHAFGREDQALLKAHTTPEVFGYLSDELRDNAEHGVRNTVEGVRMLQGDIAESWREGSREYATVAMRYESRDTVVNRETGAYISGDKEHPGETTEVWTFARSRGGAWTLSAIQGAA